MHGNDFNGFIASPPRRRHRGLGGPHPSLAAILGFVVISLGFIAAGSFLFWDQHSGVPARMTVVSCTGGRLSTCDGVLAGKGVGSASEPILVSGATRKDLGHDIDVHYHPHSRGAAVADSNPVPLLMLGAGGVSGICAVLATLRRRRCPRVKAEGNRQARAAGKPASRRTGSARRRGSNGGP
jgi:hypothetical protein